MFEATSYVGEAVGWYSIDEDFFSQSIELLDRNSAPYLAYLVTMQSHGPFHNFTDRSAHLDFSAEGISDRKVANYLRLMFEADLAFGKFVSDLKVRGLWEDSLLIVFGDHTSRVEIDGLTQLSEHVPLFIKLPGQVKGETRSKVASHVDIAPTIFDYLGLSEPEYWLGSSMLEGEDGVVILNTDPPTVHKNRSGTLVSGEMDSRLEAIVSWSEAVQ